MIFAILTLVTALALAGVAGWFSIIGVMSIYAGGPIFALVMGVVIELAKLVTISWVYRNWEYSSLKLKLPLIYFIIALMSITSIGVFGFLSKLHLEQGASTINNAAKIEKLTAQINQEQTLIAANNNAVAQLDATLDSYLGKNRADRSVTIRKRQEAERTHLRENSAEIQTKIDTLSNDKFTLESEVRKLALDVGPIRYIAEIALSSDNTRSTNENIESAVRIFTLLIVSTLDPLAVILLIAANHTLLRLNNGKEKNIQTPSKPADTSIHTDFAEDSTGNVCLPANEESQDISLQPACTPAAVSAVANNMVPEVPEIFKTISDSTNNVTVPGMSRDDMNGAVENLFRAPTAETWFPIKQPTLTQVTTQAPLKIDKGKSNRSLPQVTNPNAQIFKDAHGLVGKPSYTECNDKLSSEISIIATNTRASPEILSWITEFKRT